MVGEPRYVMEFRQEINATAEKYSITQGDIDRALRRVINNRKRAPEDRADVLYGDKAYILYLALGDLQRELGASDDETVAACQYLLHR